MKRETNRRGVIAGLLGSGALIAWAGGAQGATYTFTNITNNTPGDPAIGIAQLSLDVLDCGTNMGGDALVEFTFKNAGPAASVIEALYWDDEGGLLAAVDSIIDSPTAVDFNIGGAPPVLPGGNTVSFDEDFIVTAASPAPSRGVGPGEQVTVKFSLVGGSMFSDVIDDLNSGDMRVGMHVIAFASGGSEAFVTTAVPLPSVACLGGAGLAGLCVTRRRRG